MKQFEEGKVYHRYSAYHAHDNEHFTVVKKSQNFVTLRDADGKSYRRKIRVYDAIDHSGEFEMVAIRERVHVKAVDEVKEQPKDNETLKAEAPKTQKEVISMTKITVEQAVNAVKSATTQEAIKSVLEQCKKADMLKVFESVTGRQYEGRANPLNLKKENLANSLSMNIMKIRAAKEFQAKPFAEKYEILTTSTRHIERLEYVCLLSAEEIYTAAEKLGLAREGDYHVLADGILKELRSRAKIRDIEDAVET